MTGIAGASASDTGTAKIQTVNNSTVHEKVNIQLNNTKILNKTAKIQNKVENNVITQETKCSISTAKDQHEEQVTKKSLTNCTNQTTIEQPITQIPPTKIAENTNLTVNTSSCKNAVNQTAPKTQNAEKSDTVLTTIVKNQTSANTNKSNESSTTTLEAAAGTTKTVTQSAVTSTNFTVSEIKDAASRIKAYVDSNNRLPHYVTIGSTQVKMPDFLNLLAAGLLQLNSGTNTPVTLETVNSATKPVESIKSGNINKADYLDLAKRVNTYIDANGKLPNYTTSGLGKFGYESLIYMFSKVMAFEKANQRLPSYVTVKSVSTTTSSSGSVSTPVPADLQKYLAATANCQVNNAQIKALAASITSGKTSSYDKAVAIFNWVRDKIGYSFYYNTKKGAVGTLNAKTGNCVDTAHLLIALSRAAGLPARYVHANAKFTSGHVYGHVWAQIWVNGKWYTADATSSRNSFGVVKSWTSATIKGIYTSLPF
ncbi:MAG TPA: transglutaminase domain-containing protein [Methanobacterium sp.]|nr:transglutaminase domain-containing protein [Methanobacterium sp.]